MVGTVWSPLCATARVQAGWAPGVPGRWAVRRFLADVVEAPTDARSRHRAWRWAATNSCPARPVGPLAHPMNASFAGTVKSTGHRACGVDPDRCDCREYGGRARGTDVYGADLTARIYRTALRSQNPHPAPQPVHRSWYSVVAPKLGTTSRSRVLIAAQIRHRTSPSALICSNRPPGWG